jgi:hypothetical protein
MAAHRFVAVVGSRELPEASALQVAEVVGFFLARGWGIGSGGARGADQFALEAVVAAGAGACRGSVVFLPGAHSAAPGGALGAFVARGGRVVAVPSAAPGGRLPSWDITSSRLAENTYSRECQSLDPLCVSYAPRKRGRLGGPFYTGQRRGPARTRFG